ncbi:energy-coupling factor transporter transmembrane protein EcfT [Acidaminococcus sp. NSJ-142]|jgi:energy-coupling factor transport system permease protein|uniref:energy-coupling factor transporter transmembrane component T family protein n=1 Tax=Acidaminococcus TaxID=904 RepID=UPI000CF8860C|nr:MULTISPECIES: energy-coupling factor transporter transmembrane component T [Acidaminococcus]MCD2435661.1 energy-coupling factor transporter transmembrane protein EcfT [Acidaminococcus hominis]MCH4097092.1 energy-coupling factor transporter transmembrane protein EcfT [Acidaminococcus provencensis]RHK01659.1 energy-coupling factor transporter transmembrane protein EcfT [Acidaminococcus sp. AM05-11]
MLTDITLGQYYPGNSCIHRLDPRTKILSVLFYMVMVFMADSPLSYGLLIALIFLGTLLAKLPAGLLLRSLKPLWVIILLTMGIHFVTDPGKVLWSWKFITLTEEGIILGIKMSLRLVLLLLISSLMTFTTSPIVLTDGIESLLRPFKKIGVPAHELAMMMTIALRFIPTLLEETDRIMKAQMSRGADFSSGNIMKRARNMLPILIPLFISAFRRADELALAMEARCYRGGEGRTRMNELVYKKGDGAAALVMLGLFALLAFLKWGPLAA